MTITMTPRQIMAQCMVVWCQILLEVGLSCSFTDIDEAKGGLSGVLSGVRLQNWSNLGVYMFG